MAALEKMMAEQQCFVNIVNYTDGFFFVDRGLVIAGFPTIQNFDIFDSSWCAMVSPFHGSAQDTMFDTTWPRSEHLGLAGC